MALAVQCWDQPGSPPGDPKDGYRASSSWNKGQLEYLVLSPTDDLQLVSGVSVRWGCELIPAVGEQKRLGIVGEQVRRSTRD